ncbi:homocysteine S-methyltransferase [Secundilactobacillus oryzae]|uniref:homocysteine S-methyltransferase n=1 Tax=Secundilactobacillus oryzae TaxID=1202668 RepID=UPI0025AF8C3E|nr:homocysteine S-methyltransferase [Secundilactobacillus oryzae]
MVLDGALGTELEKLGVNQNPILWSAGALVDHPDLVKSVHYDYLEHGANILIVDTYQATRASFKRAGFDAQQADDNVRLAVQLAKEARATFYEAHPNDHQQVFIAGDIGPYGAYLTDGAEYRGDYHLSDDDYFEFHFHRIQVLIESGVDILALETIPRLDEAAVLVDILTHRFPGVPAWLSFSADGDHLVSGENLSQAAQQFSNIEQLVALGINCGAIEQATLGLTALRQASTKPLIVYPNNGDVFDLNLQKWTLNQSGKQFSDYVPEWLEAGAQIIGGCCRTTPEDIGAVANIISQNKLIETGKIK